MRTIIGTVTSAKMEKTIVVTVDSYKIHPIYKKKYKTSKKFYAHDENQKFKEGDTVKIVESRPLSKLKRWTVIEEGLTNEKTDKKEKVSKKKKDAKKVEL